MNPPIETTRIKEVADLARLMGDSWKPEAQFTKYGTGIRTEERGKPFLVVPDGATFKTIALEQFGGPRFKGAITLKDAGHFIEAVNRYKRRETRLFIDQARARVTAVVDYHEAEEEVGTAADDSVSREEQGGACEFCIALDLSPSPELEAFQALHKAGFTSQEGMSEFLLDWGYCCVEPGQAGMEQLARELTVRKGVDFRRAQNVANGEVQLTYREEVTAATQGTMEIPTRLRLAMPLWLGAEPVELEAQFRYRLADGKLALGIRLVRLLVKQREAMLTVAARIAAETGIPVWEGSSAA